MSMVTDHCLLWRKTNHQSQVSQALVNTGGRIEITDTGVEDYSTKSLRAGLRGYNLLEETTRKLSYSATSAS